MARYVFLFHETPAGATRGPHYDLMFETARGLQTWAVSHLPAAGQPPQAATELPLHRAAYLDYQGPLSEHRGSVRRVQSGSYQRCVDTEDRLELLCRHQHNGCERTQLVVFERLLAGDWRLGVKDDPAACPTNSSDAS